MKFLTFFLSFSFYYSAVAQQVENIDTLSLDSIFNRTPGTFVLYDLSKNHYQIYNTQTAKTAFAVHSTSKILWSIIGLEEGLIKNEDEITKWDSVKYPRQNGWPAGWAQNQTVITALNKSVNWYYQELLTRMTPEMAEKYLNKLSYQPDFKVEKIHYYGLTFNIKKSAIDQIEFLKRLYTNEFKISEKTLAIIKKGMTIQKTDSYTLYARTGLGPIDDNNSIGWYIGFIEKGKDVFFFALNVEDQDEMKVASLRIEYTLKILKYLNLM